jgi:hypothetical protein
MWAVVRHAFRTIKIYDSLSKKLIFPFVPREFHLYTLGKKILQSRKKKRKKL